MQKARGLTLGFLYAVTPPGVTRSQSGLLCLTARVVNIGKSPPAKNRNLSRLISNRKEREKEKEREGREGEMSHTMAPPKVIQCLRNLMSVLL